MQKLLGAFVKCPQIALRGLSFQGSAVKRASYLSSPTVVARTFQRVQSRGIQGAAGKKTVVETEEKSTENPVDLNSVCAGLNYYKTGENPPIKADSEYPEWLWTCLDPVHTYKEVPPELEKAHMRRQNKLRARENNAVRKQLGR